jgi:CubicO group peptidase (beta-lactamase class C family)
VGEKILSRAFLFLFITLLTVVGTFSSVQEKQNALEQKVDALFVELDKADSPGVAVLVQRNGEVLLRKGYGMASLEHKVPITPETVFDIASVSKQFAGMAISMLIEKGKISLKDEIHRYVPELPDFGHTITIDHLVNHTSGLRDWPGSLALAGWRMDDVISFEQILTFVFNQQDLNFEPGAEYSYSNTGYNVLAELVERVLGQTFREWTDVNIFKPLGMKNTHFQDDHTEVVPNKAYAYARSRDGKFSAVPNGLTALGSSSLYTTIDDLAKWCMNFDDPKVGGKNVVERMMQKGVLKSGKEINYAFGLSKGQYRSLKTISHGGSWASFRTYLVHFPEKKFSVVVLLNYSPSNSNQAAFNVVDIYLADELKPRSAPVKKKKPLRKPIEVPVSVLEEYVGTYRLGPAWYVTITKDGDRLMSYATAEQIVPMTARSQSQFWVEDYGSSIMFRRDEEGEVLNFIYRGMTCPKLEDIPLPTLEQLAEYEGEYESEELKTSYVVVLENGTLVAKHRRYGTISLTLGWKDDFRGGIWFMRSVEFFRDEEGRVAGFKVSQNRSRNQKFIKRN